MKHDKYVLDGKKAVPEYDLLAWARWFEISNELRVVARTDFQGATVSTVFLALDHRFTSDGPPLIFETLVLGGGHDGAMDRYSTWEEAERGHAEMLRKIGALQ